jgi:hypothetical protein
VSHDPAGVAIPSAEPPSGGWRVLRGGSYWLDADDARAACRFIWGPGIEDGDQGFRVVLPAVPELSTVDLRS